MSKNLAMYIFVNSDLDLTKGRACAQVGHVVMLITDELVRDGYETFPPSENYINYMKWKNNCTKIVLKATTDQLIELKNKPNARYFIDSGERLGVNSLTCVGFFPGSLTDDFVKDYKLL